MTREEAVNLLEEKGQSHVMRGFDDLTEEQQKGLLAQIEAVDWKAIELAGKQSKIPLGELSPLGAVEVSEIEKREGEFREARPDSDPGRQGGSAASCPAAWEPGWGWISPRES